jgi:glycosyltransferase involved in cell wall biosynthesis
MPGFVSSPQDWYAAFDVFVSPARSEPFGLVFLEAMHAGLPIVASASQGASHLANFIERPLLPVGDVSALVAALRSVRATPPPRRRYPLERFDRDRQVAIIDSFYRSALSQRDRRHAA